MRVHASGVGPTIGDAMVKVKAELATAALHAHEPVVTEISGHKIVEPERQRVENPGAAELERMTLALASLVKPQAGHLYRVLVSVNDDGQLSHAKIEVDLIRG